MIRRSSLTVLGLALIWWTANVGQASAAVPDDAYKLFVSHQWQQVLNKLKPFRQANPGYSAQMVSVDFMLGVTSCQLNGKAWGESYLLNMLNAYPDLDSSQVAEITWQVRNCGSAEQAAAAHASGKEDGISYADLAVPQAGPGQLRRLSAATLDKSAEVWARRLNADPAQLKATAKMTPAQRARFAGRFRAAQFHGPAVAQPPR